MSGLRCSRWRVVVLALAVLLAPAVLACGGGSTPEGSGEVERQYLSDICTAEGLLKAANADVLRLQQEAGGDEVIGESLELIGEATRGVFATLSASTPPAGVEEYHAAILAAYEELLVLVEDLSTALEEGEPTDTFLQRLGSLAGATDVPRLAPETWERLAEASRDVPGCPVGTSLLGFLRAPAPGEEEAPPADVAYARSICRVGKEYQDSLVSAIADMDEGDPEEFLVAMQQSGASLAVDLRAITPPDWAEDHHLTTAVFHEILGGIITGSRSAEDQARLEAIARDGYQLPLPSPAVRDRMARAATGVTECYGSGFLLTFLGEGRVEDPPTGTTTPTPAARAPDSADERYVRALCLAGEAGTFTASLPARTSSRVSISAEDPEGYERLNVEPLRRQVAALRLAKPPEDVASYHDAVLAYEEQLLRIHEAVPEAMEREGLTLDEAEERFASSFRELWRTRPAMPPGTVRDRLMEAAEAVPECAGSSYLNNFFIWSGR
ncbi:MAG: hypothetical protein OXG61_05190 [Chloroflexi bacterium]|nr:hypothetical protein [Chloroflexota bacterium]